MKTAIKLSAILVLSTIPLMISCASFVPHASGAMSASETGFAMVAVVDPDLRILLFTTGPDYAYCKLSEAARVRLHLDVSGFLVTDDGRQACDIPVQNQCSVTISPRGEILQLSPDRRHLVKMGSLNVKRAGQIDPARKYSTLSEVHNAIRELAPADLPDTVVNCSGRAEQRPVEANNGSE